LERLVRLEKGKAKGNLVLMGGEMMEKEKKKRSRIYHRAFLGVSRAHPNGPAPYFSVSPAQKIPALISCADPHLGAFHFIDRPWVLQPEIGPNGFNQSLFNFLRRKRETGGEKCGVNLCVAVS